MALEGLRYRKCSRWLLVRYTPAEGVAPFNHFSVSEIASVAAVVGTPALDAGAPVEPAAAFPAGAALTAVERLRALPAFPAGAGASLVLNFLMVCQRGR
jgi:hypothetical protein